jgi:hypothetical protein
MNQTNRRNCPPTSRSENARVYPIQSFLQIERLLKKLNMTPADGLQLLAEVLADLDRQIEDHEQEGDGLPFPSTMLGAQI